MCIGISLFRICFFSPGPSGGPHSPSVWSNCGSKSPSVSSRWFQLFSEKILVGQMILVFFARLWGKFGQKWQNSISLEPLIVRTWLTPDYDQKSHFSNNVSYNVWSQDTQKKLKIQFLFYFELCQHWSY